MNTNRLNDILKLWCAQKDEMQWVLASIIETDGSAYRKAGAMMLINSMGQHLGLLSGGCLESDIMVQARRCWDTGNNRIIQYDMREEEELAWQLGIGCGGMVRILLQPIDGQNDYLSLNALLSRLEQGQTCYYKQQVDEAAPVNALLCDTEFAGEIGQLVTTDQQLSFTHCIKPAPHMAIFGGGIDARPLAAIANNLGWKITLVDPRTSHARAQYFPKDTNIIRQELTSLDNEDWLQKIQLAIIMGHNVTLDGQALALVQNSSAEYVGMLGPVHRTDRVLSSARLTRSDLIKPLANPVGLQLGGELPESIALSIMAEAHAYIEQSEGESISGILGAAQK